MMLQKPPSVPYLKRKSKETRCDVCHGGESSISFYSVTLDEMDRARRSGCQSCHLIVLSILQAISLASTPLDCVYVALDLPKTMLSTQVVRQRYKKNSPYWRISGPDVRPGVNRQDIEIFTHPSSRPCSYTFVGVRGDCTQNRKATYLPILSNWLNYCERTHSVCTRSNTPLPSRVLDLGTSESSPISLYVSRRESARYTALSHCWGAPGHWQTTKANFTIRQQGIPLSELPQTFRDAVHVTRDLGIRYLWIDSFCIIQDNREDWEAESGNMAAIYNGAHLIIGADKAKDSEVGFLAIEGTFRESPRVAIVENNDGSTSKVYARVYKNHGDLCSPLTVESEPASPVAGRGWTLQEQILSSRMVHFTEDELFWECRTGTYCQCWELDNKALAMTVPIQNYKISLEYEASNGQFHFWHRIIQQYQLRYLTKASDFLPALSGIARLMQKYGAGEYLAGLWKRILLEDMLWFNRLKSLYHRAHPYRAPTWSWASLEIASDSYNSWIERNYSVFFWGEEHEIGVLSAQILDASCTPSRKDPTGAVTSGYITLVGRLLPAVFLSGDFDDFSLYFDIYQDRELEQRLYYLLISTCRAKSSSSSDLLVGLLLTKSSSNVETYERVGFFHTTDGPKREGRDDMFKNVADTILTIF